MKLDQLDYTVIFAVLVAILVIVWIIAPEAQCWECLPTFCGSGSECPDGCHCFIPFGEVVGSCG